MTDSAKWYRWEELPMERLGPLLERRYLIGDSVMLAQFHLKRGCVVPEHSHENEQLTSVLRGALRFTLGEGGGEERTVRAGEVLHLPAGLPHAAEALEDTLVLDVFSPPRQDWLDGTDDYLRDT